MGYGWSTPPAFTVLANLGPEEYPTLGRVTEELGRKCGRGYAIPGRKGVARVVDGRQRVGTERGKLMISTVEDYAASLRALRRRVYAMGERIEDITSHPLTRPSFLAVAQTYELARDAQHAHLFLAESPILGSKVNRFTHIHCSTTDLVAKVKMLRLLGQVTGCCFQRCVGMDALNALYSVTYDIDVAMGTRYHRRFVGFLQKVQRENLVCGGAMTDPKGDRGLRPSQQADPDLYLHVVDKNADGMVVRGAKCHQTGTLNAHEIIVMPTAAMGPEEQAYAVSFAVPTDAPGLTYVLGRQPSDTRKLEGWPIDVGSAYGGHEVLVVFQDVFVPWERVFLFGEHQFAGVLVERFAAYHRQSYGGCKVGVGDVIVGAAALAAEIHGVDRASHVRDKLVEMVHLNETMYACGLACSSEGWRTPSGAYMVDVLLANVCKLNVTRLTYEIARLAEDLAGGLLVTMPSQADLEHPEIGPLVRKYLSARVNAETRMRVLRLIEFLTTGPGGAAYRTESMHGAGSPQTQRVMIGRQAHWEKKKELAKRLACVT